MNQSTSIIVTKDMAERAVTLPEAAKKIKVTDQGSLVRANQFIGTCKDLMDEISAAFDPHIRKALELKRSLEAEKAKYFDAPNQARAVVRAEISRYALEQSEIIRKAELEQQEIQRKARVALESGRLKTSEKIMAKIEPPPAPPKAAGLSFRDDWKFEVEDEKKIPRKYLVPDFQAIGRDVRTYKEQCVIPGVRVFMVKTPIQR
jgi:hypothetical protein